MQLLLHHPDDLTELREVVALQNEERMSLEVRDDGRFQITSAIHRVSQHGALRSFRPDVSATEVLLELLEYRSVIAMLIHLKARCDKPSPAVADGRMGMDADTEASLSVDESRHVLWSQPTSRPSLLIVPTRRIVTDHDGTLTRTADMDEYRGIHGMFQHIAEFSNGQLETHRYSYGRRLPALRFGASLGPEGPG
jgi:hypothetical protein